MTAAQASRISGISADRCAIGLDIGGTKIAGAVVGGDGRIVEQLDVDTPADGQGVLSALLDMVRDLRRRYPQVEAVGAGAAGIVEWPDGHIRWAPSSPYENLPLRRLLEDSTRLPTVIDNDANAAAWAEAQFGGPTSRRNMIFLTVGTGIGGGVLLDGVLYRGPTGMATEIGHVVVDPRGPLCACGNRGCLEAFASGTALEEFGRQAASEHPTSLLARAAADTGRLTGKAIRDLARRGDTLAEGLFEQLGYWLGVGIATLINIFEVEAVVVGGGLVEAGDLFLDSARTSVERHTFARRHRPMPAILAGGFGCNAGVIGAAHLALSHLPPVRSGIIQRSHLTPARDHGGGQVSQDVTEHPVLSGDRDSAHPGPPGAGGPSAPTLPGEHLFGDTDLL